ncbi:hypothetical protein GW17_00017087 [Ensete ventricosum]|nr:hypothetical protein GW17_00017087 [Ensete ventricosum]
MRPFACSSRSRYLPVDSFSAKPHPVDLCFLDKNRVSLPVALDPSPSSSSAAPTLPCRTVAFPVAAAADPLAPAGVLSHDKEKTLFSLLNDSISEKDLGAPSLLSADRRGSFSDAGAASSSYFPPVVSYSFLLPIFGSSLVLFHPSLALSIVVWRQLPPTTHLLPQLARKTKDSTLTSSVAPTFSIISLLQEQNLPVFWCPAAVATGGILVRGSKSIICRHLLSCCKWHYEEYLTAPRRTLKWRKSP